MKLTDTYKICSYVLHEDQKGVIRIALNIMQLVAVLEIVVMQYKRFI